MASESVILILITAFIVFDFIFDNALSWLNARNWKEEVHPRLRDAYPEQKYTQARLYALDKNRLSLAASTFNLAIVLAMLFTGGFAFVDGIIGKFTGSPILRGILFFMALALVSDLLNLPFQWHSVFGIEEKYGFNRSTRTTFWGDKIRTWVLSAIVGGGLLWMIMGVYYMLPDYFWLIAWGIVMVFMLFMILFYSNIIVPLFNRQKPLENGELRNAIEKFASENGFSLNNIYVIDGSRRTSRANAYFTGLGPKKRIVLYDTLVARHSVSELVAVLAHEIGHYRMKHTLKGFIISAAQVLVILYLFNVISREEAVPKALGMAPGFHASLLAFAMLLGPLNHGIGIIGNFISRNNEYAADRYAYERTRSDDLARALIQLSVDNLTSLTPHPLYVFMHYGHPPLLERLARLDRLREGEHGA